jgi:CPA2 family monovalent cation:H+ antiporter-2
MAMSMSSTAVGLRLLQQRRQMHSMHGRIAFGILIVQDMLALVVLGVLPLVAAWAGVHPSTPAPDTSADAGTPAPLRMLLHAATALAGIAVLIAVGRRVLPRLLREAAKDSSSETLLVLSAAVALGAAALTRFLGFSPELGAFLAGFLLAATPFKYQLSGQLAPMRDLFLAVFFTTVGLQLDGRELVRNWEVILLGLPALLVCKSLIIGVGSWLSGATPPTAFMTGVGLSQASEFTLVVLAVAGGAGGAGGLGIIDDTLMGQAVTLVVLSLALAPTLYQLAERWQERFAKLPTAKWMRNSPLAGVKGETSGHAGEVSRHIIIAGFGVVGRNIAEHFGAAGLPFTIVELNPTTVSRQRKLGRSIIFGDVANPEVLETAGIHCAEAVILTIPDEEATLRACRSIRQIAPKVFIAARTANLSRAIVATDLGADHVTVEEVATAQEMARQVMSRLESRRAAGEAAAPEAAPVHEKQGEPVE